MSDKELIETLKAFEEKRVENLPESARNLFYAIMKIADERDTYKTIIKEVREYIDDNKIYDIIGDCINSELLGILDKDNK